MVSALLMSTEELVVVVDITDTLICVTADGETNCIFLKILLMCVVQTHSPGIKEMMQRKQKVVRSAGLGLEMNVKPRVGICGLSGLGLQGINIIVLAI